MNANIPAKCVLCGRSNEIKIDAFIWLTLGEGAGFRTDPFNICSKCSGILLWELKSYLDIKLKLKKS